MIGQSNYFGFWYYDTQLKSALYTQLPYRLHAVLVHEGQASGGHYWAYIQDPTQQRWCKFNDITVSEVTWDEVSRESLGGYRHVSAYCLMYIDARREGCIGAGSAVQELPADLQELVDKDNAEFENEMRDWDEKQLNKTAGKWLEQICNLFGFLYGGGHGVRIPAGPTLEAKDELVTFAMTSANG